MTINSDKLPLDLMDELAESETFRRDVYRPIYSLHKWWARRPGSTFRCLGLAALTNDDVMKDDILHTYSDGSHGGLYVQPDDQIETDSTILDPFAGGGTTLVELNRLGADVIGYELNPVAWWIEKKSTDDVNLDVLEREYENLLADAQDELGDLYKTVDPATGKECDVLYYFQTQKLPCLTCDETVKLFSRYELARNKATRPGTLYCPNDSCDDRIININRDAGLDAGHEVTLESGETRHVSEDGMEICPSCGFEFDPADGNYGYGKYTCSNGHKHDLKETLNRRNETPTFQHFAIQYVDPRGDKKFKEPDEDDYRRIREAKERYENLKDRLPIPDQAIPDGDKTKALQNYNYEKFRELFTQRHLLTFGWLFKRAMDVSNKEFDDADAANISEFLITGISNCLERNSKLTMWNYIHGHGENVFRRHAFVPRPQPIEPSPFGSHNASLDNALDKVYEGKKFCQRPFEKIKNKQKGEVQQYYVENEEVAEERRVGLHCKTAERLDEPDESIDYVITDPPYYDNVQYSELSDYFYVWLHECLKGEYEAFESELVPKSREIVANKNAGKDEEFFVNSLSNVFSECYRVLKDDGELAFTYHHTESEAWSVILRAIIESGFSVTGAYPVQSERSTSPHISDLDNTEYDIVITANKEEVDEETTLQELKQTLYFDVQDWLEEERQLHRNMSVGDLGVILRGRCLYHFSKHYPDIYHEGEQVSVEKALETADEVITQVLESVVDLPTSIDVVTRAYVGHLNRVNESVGSETFDDLRKHLMPQNLNVSDLEDEHLVEGPRTEKQPMTPKQRVNHIEDKLNRNGDVLAIDKVHYLYHLFTTDQDVAEYLRRWKDDDLEQLADKMEEITGDEAYSQMMNLTLSNY